MHLETGFLSVLFYLAAAGALAGADPGRPCPAALPALETRYKNGILFKIEKCGLPPSYLLGTVHTAAPDITRSAGAVFLYLSEAKAVGFEIAPFQQEISALAQRYMLAPLVTLEGFKRQLGTASYDKLMVLVRGTRFNLHPEELARIRPWAIAIMLEVLDDPAGSVLDEKIKTTAVNMGKPVFGLEEVRDQFAIFEEMPQPLQWRMLTESIDEHAKITALKKTTLEAYLAHDLKKLYDLEDSMMKESKDQELDAYLSKYALTDRNHNMEKRLVSKLPEGILACVGAMHLMGEQGMLHLLEIDGYNITPLP